MELDKAIKGRRSVRKFKKKKIERRVIEEIIEAGKYAPSACNMQMWHFLVVDDDKIKDMLCTQANCPPIIREASFVIFVLYDKNITPERYANIQSAAAAIQNMLLKSYSMGIGSVWMCAYGDKKNIRKILKIPRNFLLVATVCFGYPAEKPKCPTRRHDVISYNIFKKQTIFPTSFNPREWDIEQIKNFRSFKIRAKSPLSPEHQPPVDPILQKIVEEIEPLEGRVLDVFPYFSNHIHALLLSKKVKDLWIYEMSKEIINFLKIKFRQTNIKIKFTEGLEEFPFNNEFFDAALSFYSLEMVPNPEKIIKEIYRVLKKRGVFYLLFTNKYSPHGFFYFFYSFLKKNKSLYTLSKKILYPIYRKSDLPRGVYLSVPRKPLSYNEIRKLLTKFEITKCLGFKFLPKLRFSTKSPIKYCCNYILIKAVKR